MIHAPVYLEDGSVKIEPKYNHTATLCGTVAKDSKIHFLGAYDNPPSVDITANQNDYKMVRCKRCLAIHFKKPRKKKSKDPFMSQYETEKKLAAKEAKENPTVRTPEQIEIASLRGVIRFAQQHLKPNSFIEKGRFVTADQIIEEMLTDINKKGAKRD